MIQLEGIAQGLAYLHSLSITHGDIKHVRISWLRTKRRSHESSQLNILIDHLRCPRLADFGLVRLDDSVTLGGFTQTTNGLDPRWASPQRLDDAVRALSDDVYSFGCIGYYVSREDVWHICKLTVFISCFPGLHRFMVHPISGLPHL
jgi:serine/threonine protein kinase